MQHICGAGTRHHSNSVSTQDPPPLQSGASAGNRAHLAHCQENGGIMQHRHGAHEVQKAHRHPGSWVRGVYGQASCASSYSTCIHSFI